ncbi:glycosyltransferase family 2 protein [Pararhizobium sp. DWP1-1-3]|uniref:glycosyltransferase family 2 protein n=1 Tax=Pararhizobium sp. DWP1-1-3 TaxID=2804652 RepID=UPI003CE87B57
MGQLKTVSVVLPVFNGERYLQQTLSSISSQTYRTLQVVIVNDGSSDESRRICLEWIEQHATEIEITFVDNFTNMGVCNALREACTLATGEYIAQIGHDDVWMPNHLLELVAILECQGSAAAFSDVGYIDGNGNVITSHIFDHDSLGTLTRPQLFAKMLSGNFICAPASMFRRDLYRKEFWGLHNERLQDYQLWLNLLLEGDFVRVKKTTMHYRLHDNNLSSGKTLQVQSQLELFEVQQKILSSSRMFDFLDEIYNDFVVFENFMVALVESINIISGYYPPLQLNCLVFLEKTQEKFPNAAIISNLRINLLCSMGALRKGLLVSKTDVSLGPCLKQGVPILLPANRRANEGLFQFLIESGWFRDGRVLNGASLNQGDVFYLALQDDYKALCRFDPFRSAAKRKRVFLAANQIAVSFGPQCLIPNAKNSIGYREFDKMLSWVEDARNIR